MTHDNRDKLREMFRPDFDKITLGYYSAEYFNRAHRILEEELPDLQVTMQVFQKAENAVICGINEAIDLILHGSDYGGERLTIYALEDGDTAEPGEPVMHIHGPLADFVHLESIYLGMLRDGTTVATNIRNAVKAAKGKEVIYLADRFNRYSNQEAQGYAAIVGGATAVCTQAGAEMVGAKPIGTMPHALIAAFDGDVVKASVAFRGYYPETPLVALVDFNNDCVTDVIRVAEALGDGLYAVRLDTSEKMMDLSIQKGSRHPHGSHFHHTPGPSGDASSTRGVCPKLVWNVRQALDGNGFQHVKIVVSGGFDPGKIERFESNGVPVDIYGVGSSALKGGSDFTADVVIPRAKRGRQIGPASRLTLVQ